MTKRKAAPKGAKVTAKHGGPRGMSPGGPSGPPPIDWRRMLTGAALGILAVLLLGVLPLRESWAIRGVVCGLVVGLSVRSPREVAPAAGLAAAAGLIATGVLALVPAGQNSIAPVATDAIVLACVGVAIAAALGWVSAGGRTRAAVLLALTILVGLQLYQMGASGGKPYQATAALRQQIKSEPVAEQYAFDGDMFVKIDHLMARGVPYYEAFLQAFDGDQRLQGPPTGLFNIRQRWLFELWHVLPGPPGLRVLWWFQVLVVATMLGGYSLARRFVEPAAALVAPVAIGGYMLLPALTPWFPLFEYWAGMVAVFFLYAMVTERWTWAAVLSVVAFAFRELMLFLVPVYLAWWLISGRRREALTGLAISLAGPATLVGLHVLWSPIRTQSPEGTAHWLQGGLDRLAAALRFSGALVESSGWLYLVVPLLALVGALATRALWTKVLLGTGVAVPVIALTVFSGGQWNDYWGAITMPSLLALAPLVAGWLVPSALARLDASATARPGFGEDRIVRWRLGSPEKVPRGGAVLFAPERFAVEPETVAAMEAAWTAGADVVVASRVLPGAKTAGGFGRSLALRALSALCACVAPVPGLTDPTSPVMLVGAEALSLLAPEARARLAIEGPPATEALVSLRGLARVREVPWRADGPAEPASWGALSALVAARLRRVIAADAP